MRKIIIFLLLLTIQPAFKLNKNSFAVSNDFSYAKISANCVMYKTSSMTDDYSNILFIIPESYFVLVLDDSISTSYKVKYDSYIGYVKPEKIKLVNFVPKTKTLDGVTLDINPNFGTQIWSQPSTFSGTALTTIKASTENITYVASATGDVPSGGISNIWYYVVFTPIESPTDVYEGYVYSENVSYLSEIKLNNEDIIEESMLKIEQNNQKMSSTLKIIIIVLISIPLTVFLILILYKCIKNIVKNTNSNKNCEKYKNENFNDFSEKKLNFGDNNLITSNNTALKKNINYLSNRSFKKISHQDKFDDEDDDLL